MENGFISDASSVLDVLRNLTLTMLEFMDLSCIARFVWTNWFRQKRLRSTLTPARFHLQMRKDVQDVEALFTKLKKSLSKMNFITRNV